MRLFILFTFFVVSFACSELCSLDSQCNGECTVCIGNRCEKRNETLCGKMCSESNYCKYSMDGCNQCLGNPPRCTSGCGLSCLKSEDCSFPCDTCITNICSKQPESSDEAIRKWWVILLIVIACIAFVSCIACSICLSKVRFY